MGMFDTIKCNWPGIDSKAASIDFQTKDLDCTLTLYEITKEGRLVEHCWDWETTPEAELPCPEHPFLGCIRQKADSFRLVDLNFHGVLSFYGDVTTGELRMINLKTGVDELHPDTLEHEWYEYEAKFTDGQIVSLTRINTEQ